VDCAVLGFARFFQVSVFFLAWGGFLAAEERDFRGVAPKQGRQAFR